jgi:hypothetical protein
MILANMRLPNLLLAVGVLALTARISNAEDLTTLDGQTFTNITDIAKYPKLITFTYNGKIKTAATTNLPEDFRAKYGIKVLVNSIVSSPVSQQNPVDTFLFQNKDSFVVECAYSYIFTNFPERSSEMSLNTNDIWQLCIEGAGVDLNSRKIDENSHEEVKLEIHFQIGQEVVIKQVFDKFLEWDSIAKTSNAESFDRDIAKYGDLTSFGDLPPINDEPQTFTFYWDKRMRDSSLMLSDNSYHHSIFYIEDVVNFSELLKQIPDVKNKLVETIKNKNAQKNLFK